MEYNTDSPYNNKLVTKGSTGTIQEESNSENYVNTPPLTGNIGGILIPDGSSMSEQTSATFTVSNKSDAIIIETPLSIQDTLLNDSRISPTGNGNPASKPYCTPPTSGNKWCAAVLLGFIFALVSSPAAYYVSSKVTTSLGGISTMEGTGPNFVGLLIHTLVFIIIVRIILW